MSNNTVGVQALSQAAGIVNRASGIYTGDGSGSVQLFIGFTPSYVMVYDDTDATKWEWMEGMPATHSIKTVTGGTQTSDTGSAIVTNASVVTVTEVAPEGAPGAQGPGEGTQGTVSVSIDAPVKTTPQLTLATGLNVNAKVYAFLAIG